MARKHEPLVIESIEDLGYTLGEDFVRQHPIGERFVIDIAFVPEKFAIEVDGDDHSRPDKRKLDKKRDAFLYDNGWVVLRVLEHKYFSKSTAGSYYKFLIREVVEAWRQQLNGGRLSFLEIPEFKDEDY